MKPSLDRFDLLILAALQVDARKSLAEIAAQVGLSPSPTWRRIKAMEDAGVIERQVAILNPQSLGLLAVAYVHVSLVDHSAPALARFASFVQDEDRIVECATVTGRGGLPAQGHGQGPRGSGRLFDAASFGHRPCAQQQHKFRAAPHQGANGSSFAGTGLIAAPGHAEAGLKAQALIQTKHDVKVLHSRA